MALRTLTRTAAVGAAVVAAALLGAGPALAQTPAPPPPAAGSPQQAGPTERAAATVRPAVTYLTSTFSGYVADETGTYFNNGSPYQLTSTCTGFGVNPAGYVATAGHCVDVTSPTGIRSEFIKAAAEQVVAAIPTLDLATVYAFGMANWSVEGQTKGSPVDAQIAVLSGATTGGGANVQALPARVVDFRPFEQGDVALLKVETTDLPTVELATDADVQIGTPLLSIGYPASADAVTDPSLEPSNKDGQVSSKKTVGTVPVYETSAALTPGMSGGPTVDLSGKVLGVNSFKPAAESQAFNFVAPAQGLSELLSRNGVRNELGPDDKAFRAALDAYYAGHYTEAIAGFDRLLQVHPQHAQATQFRTLAAKARDRFGDTPVAPPAPEGMSPVLLWSLVGGGALLLIGGVVVAVLVTRRRRAGGAGAAAAAVGPRDPMVPLGWGGQPRAPFPGGPQQYAPPAPYGPPAGQQSMPVPPQGWPVAVPAQQSAGVAGADRAGAAGPGWPQPAGAPGAGQVRPQQPAGPAVNGAPADASAAPTAVVNVPSPVACLTCGSTIPPGVAACTTCGRPRG